MTLKILAAAAACSLATVGAASAQTIVLDDAAYMEPAPAYVAPAPGYVVASPGYYVAAPSPFSVQSGPRYEYNDGTYGVAYTAPAYAPPLSCTLDAWGIRTCE